MALASSPLSFDENLLNILKYFLFFLFMCFDVDSSNFGKLPLFSLLLNAVNACRCCACLCEASNSHQGVVFLVYKLYYINKAVSNLVLHYSI